MTGDVGTDLASPYWCARQNALRCIDRATGDVLTVGTRNGARVLRQSTGSTSGCLVVPRADSGVIVVADLQLAIASRDDLSDLQLWGTLLADARQRCMTGGCSPTGRLYLGTVGWGRTPGIAMVFRIDAGEAGGRPVAAGLTAVSGIAWSPDHRHCYVIDDDMALVFDYERDVAITNQRDLFRSMFGACDGLTVDAGGSLWISHTEAGVIERRDPDGTLLDVVELPGVTATTFGGPGLSTLYATAGGAIWELQPGVAGMLTLPFRGERPRKYT